MITQTKLFSAALLLATVVAGCQCNGPGTKRREASIEVEKSLVEFGQVQVDYEHEQSLRIVSAGSSALNIVELKVAEPFGIRDVVPLSIGSGDNMLLTVTFKPTQVGKRELGHLIIVSDDPERPEVRITLQGTGIQATAVPTPNPLDFGDVFQGETKTLTLTINNKGSNELKVLGAEFLADTPADLTGDLGPIAQNVPAGGSTKAEISFKPSQMSDAIPGGVRLIVDPVQGGELVVPFKGRGIRSLPQLCWQFEGQGVATCTDVNAAQGVGANLPIQFPALCDSKIYPPDAGTSPCGDTPYTMSGQLFVKNDGNVPIKYSMQYTSAQRTKLCADGGTVTDPDFRLSNAPAPNVLNWPEATVTLPPYSSSTPVTVTYRPTATPLPIDDCEKETSDSAMVLWTRQGDSLAEQQRQPINLNIFFTGQSRLPQAESAPMSFNIQGSDVQFPRVEPFVGVKNEGIASFQVTNVTLFEAIDPNAPDKSCAGSDAGIFQACDLNPVLPSDCYFFGWADGGNPNDNGPHTVPFSTDGGTTTTVLGQIAFGPKGTPPPGKARCVYAVIETSDPFHPRVISEIKGAYQP